MAKNLFIPKQTLSEKESLGPYEITFEPMPGSLAEKLPSIDLKYFLSLFEKAQKTPSLVRKELEEFRNKYPLLPELNNLLCYVYFKLKKRKKGERLIQECYEKNPDYFFAKINFADQCLRNKKSSLVPQIFDQCFDIKALYPEKKIFHFSEFRGFNVTCAFYFLAANQIEKAKVYHFLALQADPTHSSVIALEKRLFNNNTWLQKLLRKFKRQSQVS